ncbi:MAG: hypothetical protein D6701_08960 [Gemmatimonadetes bacterium]|nr:MAG: hypothetical protein D6701_08960 [Gemmatimonadota bacterium]
MRERHWRWNRRRLPPGRRRPARRPRRVRPSRAPRHPAAAPSPHPPPPGYSRTRARSPRPWEAASTHPSCSGRDRCSGCWRWGWWPGS